MGTSLEDRPRYTPTSMFETFPFPWPLNPPDEVLTAQQRRQRYAIGAAARALDEARRRWLNPPELVREEPDVRPSLPPRLLPVDEAAESELRKRTLTNLYNARPAWLSHLRVRPRRGRLRRLRLARVRRAGHAVGGGAAGSASGAESRAGWGLG